MRIPVSANLVKLAKLFKKKNSKLYIVGGCVRNSVIGIPAFDVDLCSSMTLDNVMQLLEGTEFEFKVKDQTLGTATICIEQNCWEYCVFRKEIYDGTGAHRPLAVEFIDDINEDASRRDFTMNALYLDINKGLIIDPLNAIKDIRKKTIRAVCDPNTVFANDGLRILRMIRLSSELNFNIDYKTFVSAGEHTKNLLDISGTRKRKELLRLLASSNKYPGHTNKRAYIHGLNKYNKLALWKYFNLPVYKVKYSMVKKVEPEHRLLGLIIDIVCEVRPRDRFAFLTNFLGVDGLNFSAEEVQTMTNVICGYLDAIEKMNNKDYFFKYFQNFPQIAPLLKKKSLNLYAKYNFFYKYLINNKIAIQVKDLDIKGTDIKKNFPNIPQKRFAYILNELLSKVFDGAIKNDKKSLLEEVKNYDY